ncbi:MAG TPA: aldolase/citrate lyase family protein [Propionibacteriaceae bacterium]|nr:aldolase/citrate lyase family protein [Propionibacteriaceae bacterium]
MTGGFGPDSRGVWCNDSSPGAVARLAQAGFDWVSLDAQHGVYGRSELVEAARSFPEGTAALVVRVAACDFAAIGAALDVGASTVIVPQVDSPGEAARAVAATYYPPRGRRSRGQIVRTWGRPETDPTALNAVTTCAVMIESADALDQVEAIAAVPGVSCLFVGPYDLALTLGTTVDALLDDDAPGSPLARITAAAADQGLFVGAFGGVPAYAARFAGRGIGCLVVATDLWLLEAGAAAALDR